MITPPEEPLEPWLLDEPEDPLEPWLLDEPEDPLEPWLLDDPLFFFRHFTLVPDEPEELEDPEDPWLLYQPPEDPLDPWLLEDPEDPLEPCELEEPEEPWLLYEPPEDPLEPLEPYDEYFFFAWAFPGASMATVRNDRPASPRMRVKEMRFIPYSFLGGENARRHRANRLDCQNSHPLYQLYSSVGGVSSKTILTQPTPPF